MNKLIFTDGSKAVGLLNSDDPEVWNFYSGQKTSDATELYGRVAAAFTAVNKKALAVASVPFAIVKGKTEIDASQDWQNKLGFMPNPRELIRRTMQSLIMSNRAYWIMGKNVAGYPKRLNFVTAPSIQVNTDPLSGRLLSLSRVVNGITEKTYSPDDNELIRFWWLDADTELIPTDNTQFKAIMNSAGILYWADTFTKLYFQRGGVKPTLIAMKGLVSRDKTEELQNDWTTFVRRIGQGARNIAAKIFNAEAMDIKPFGEGLGDLKETPVFRKALEDIAMGMGIPLSILLANSANYATAQTEYASFYRDEAVPWFDFIADAYNEQYLIPLGYKMENRMESQDSEQEEEVQRQTAATGFGDVFTKYPSYDLLVSSLAGIFGYELPDDFLVAAKKYYDDKEKEPEPVPVVQNAQPPAGATPEDDEEEPEEDMPKAWLPSIDQLDEMRIWREVATRRFKRAEPMDFEYTPHKGGLPKDVMSLVRASLSKADSIQSIKAAFDMDRLGAVKAVETTVQPAPAPDNEIIMLATALNKAAEAMSARPTKANDSNAGQ